MWKKKITLALVLVMMFVGVSPVFALTDAEIHRQVVEACIAEKERLDNIGKYSSEYLNQSIIDLTYVNQGTVVSYTYIGDNQDFSINTHIINSQTNSSAADKLTRFVFQIRNMYYPENAVGISVSQDRNTVHSVTYGPQRDEAMYAITLGLKECLDNEPIRNSSSGGSVRDNPENAWLEKYSPEQIKATITELAEQLSIYTADLQNWLLSLVSKVSAYIAKW